MKSSLTRTMDSAMPLSLLRPMATKSPPVGQQLAARMMVVVAGGRSATSGAAGGLSPGKDGGCETDVARGLSPSGSDADEVSLPPAVEDLSAAP